MQEPPAASSSPLVGAIGKARLQSGVATKAHQAVPKLDCEVQESLSNGRSEVGRGRARNMALPYLLRDCDLLADEHSQNVGSDGRERCPGGAPG